ncbi:hypothetical protein LZ30DRAFT_734298, partial [Colletotrichum cereale]
MNTSYLCSSSSGQNCYTSETGQSLLPCSLRIDVVEVKFWPGLHRVAIEKPTLVASHLGQWCTCAIRDAAREFCV